MKCYNHGTHSNDVRACKLTKTDGATVWAWWCAGCRDEAMASPDFLAIEVSERPAVLTDTRG